MGSCFRGKMELVSVSDDLYRTWKGLDVLSLPPSSSLCQCWPIMMCFPAQPSSSLVIVSFCNKRVLSTLCRPECTGDDLQLLSVIRYAGKVTASFLKGLCDSLAVTFAFAVAMPSAMGNGQILLLVAEIISDFACDSINRQRLRCDRLSRYPRLCVTTSGCAGSAGVQTYCQDMLAGIQTMLFNSKFSFLIHHDATSTSPPSAHLN